MKQDPRRAIMKRKKVKRMPAKKQGKRYVSSLEASSRYREKTYDTVIIRLRKEDDADLIEYVNAARRSGKTSREWLRDLYNNTKREK